MHSGIDTRLVASLAIALILPISSGFGGSPSTGCTITHYQLIELPLLPAAINDAGQVAGTTRSHRAAIWSAKNGLRELPLPRGFDHSEAVAINGRGHVVGMVYDRGFNNHQPFFFANDALTLLEGNQARAYHISNNDEVAGESVLAGKTQSEPVVWRHRRILPLGTCCGGSVKRIDDQGDAIGDAYDERGRYYAYMWTEAGGLRRIGPPDRFSSAVAANNRGHVVIDVLARVFLYADERSTRLELPSKGPTHAHAINDCDVIVGSFGPFSDADRAFAWEKSTGFQDLNARIPSDSGWKLESATGVNNRGEIIGKGDPPGEEDSGFLLLPE